MKGLTWTCHVCGDERPDSAISVCSKTEKLGGVIPMTVNVRYCNDRRACLIGAPAKAEEMLYV